MTITTQTLRSDYTANGVNTSFAFNFPIFYESNANPKFSLQVITTDANGVETIKTETTDYAITYSTIENGVIASGNVVFGTAPTNGHKVSILRKVNLTQNAEFTNKGTDKFSGGSVEAALDKLTLLALQTEENLNRVVKIPKSSQLSNIEFPISASVADEVICVNSAGNNLSTKNLIDVSLAPVSTYIRTLLDDATAAAARTTLDAQQLNTNLSALSGLTGASNKVPYFTGAGAMALGELIATTTARGSNFLDRAIILSNNATTPNTKIDFSAGTHMFANGTNTAIISATTAIIQSSGSWTAGNDQNKLDTGARASSTWYYSYIIQNNTSGAFDILLSASATSPTVPSGWTNVARIKNGDIYSDGTNVNYRFKKYANGLTKYLVSPTGYTDYTVLNPASQSNTLQSITVPNRSNIGAIVQAVATTSGGASDIISCSYDGSIFSTIPTVVEPTFDILCQGTQVRWAVREKLCITDSAQIRFTTAAGFASNTGSRSLSFLTLGYFDLNN